LNEYDGVGKVKSVSFQLIVKGYTLAFRLPAKVDGVYKVMYGNRTKAFDRKRAQAQAERTAWRIIKDWIDAQLALVEAECAEMAEVFLPYALKADGSTMYEALIESNMKLLT
jgi:hypothetical protein